MSVTWRMAQDGVWVRVAAPMYQTVQHLAQHMNQSCITCKSKQNRIAVLKTSCKA